MSKPREYTVIKCSGKDQGKEIVLVEKSAYDELEKKYQKALEDVSHSGTIGVMYGAERSKDELKELKEKADKLAEALEFISKHHCDQCFVSNMAADVLKEYRGEK